MEKKNEMMQEIIKYHGAVQAIKTAILQGQYEAAKGVNRIQLAVYFAIGKYCCPIKLSLAHIRA